MINLAGEPIVNKRWTAKQKLKLCNSRWQLTSALTSKISEAQCPPTIFISGSAIGIYGRQGVSHIDESFQDFYIPLKMMKGEKPTTATLEKDWAWSNQFYTFSTPKEIKKVEIDSSGLMADINRGNNVFIAD